MNAPTNRSTSSVPRTTRRGRLALLASAALFAAGAVMAPTAMANGSVAVSVGLPGLAIGYSSRGVGFVAAAPYAPTYYAPPVVSYPAPYYAPAPVYYAAPVPYLAPVFVGRPYYGGYYRPYYRSARVVYRGRY
jgi:hypothetical protein